VPAATRTLILAIDAATPDLVERWAADGTLPHLGKLFARGVSGRVLGLDGFFVGSTWPSFYTGSNPAEHGLHYLVQLRRGGYDFFRPADGELVRREPFWLRLSRAGRRVAVLDVPLTQLDPAVNGIQVVEWGGHDSVYGFRTSPPALASELLERFGPHPGGDTCDARRTTPEDYRSFRDTLIQGARLKGELTQYVIGLEPWDLVMQVFTEAHCAGHQCWHLHDPSHPAHEPGLAAGLGDPLRDVYEAIDTAIGRILESVGDTTRVLVCSAHGMGHWYSAQNLLPEILIRLGVAHRPQPRSASQNGASWLARTARRAWRWLPAGMREALMPVRNRVRPPGPPQHLWTSGLDPNGSPCFPVSNGFPVAGIRLNLVGREPAGIITPGPEAKQFIARLAADLLAITEERTGAPLVRRLTETAMLYQGEHLDALPDLLVEWNDEVVAGSTAVGNGQAAVVRVRSPRIGELETVNGYGRTGDHRPHGFFVAVGPGLNPRRLDRPVSLLDFAPSLEAWAGLTPTPGDGRPIEALVSGNGHS